MTFRVILADDQSLLRSTFKLLLDTTDDITVVAEAATGVEAVAQARAHRPDLVLMDISMPEMSGIEATRLITSDASLAGVRVLVLTTFETEDLVLQALRAGASGYLGKGVQPGSLLDAIRTVARGESLLSPSATTALIKRYLDKPDARAGVALPVIDDLTTRERELTVLVASGLSNEDIAERLYISPSTAKTHINRAMMKVGARDRAQLVVFAYESGMMIAGRSGQDSSL